MMKIDEVTLEICRQMDEEGKSIVIEDIPLYKGWQVSVVRIEDDNYVVTLFFKNKTMDVTGRLTWVKMLGAVRHYLEKVENNVSYRVAMESLVKGLEKANLELDKRTEPQKQVEDGQFELTVSELGTGKENRVQVGAFLLTSHNPKWTPDNEDGIKIQLGGELSVASLVALLVSAADGANKAMSQMEPHLLRDSEFIMSAMTEVMEAFTGMGDD